MEKTFICKRLGLMGRTKDESLVNFDSMPCSAFNSRSDKADIALKSLSVSHNGSSQFLRGGIRANLTDDSAAYETPKFSFDNSTNYEMNIADFNPKKISIQSFNSVKESHWPYGWKITSYDIGKSEIDVVGGLKKDVVNKRYEHEYATIEPNQTIIGIYGRIDSDSDLFSIGFIVKEEVLAQTAI